MIKAIALCSKDGCGMFLLFQSYFTENTGYTYKQTHTAYTRVHRFLDNSLYMTTNHKHQYTMYTFSTVVTSLQSWRQNIY